MVTASSMAAIVSKQSCLEKAQRLLTELLDGEKQPFTVRSFEEISPQILYIIFCEITHKLGNTVESYNKLGHRIFAEMLDTLNIISDNAFNHLSVKELLAKNPNQLLFLLQAFEMIHDYYKAHHSKELKKSISKLSRALEEELIKTRGEVKTASTSTDLESENLLPAATDSKIQASKKRSSSTTSPTSKEVVNNAPLKRTNSNQPANSSSIKSEQSRHSRTSLLLEEKSSKPASETTGKRNDESEPLPKTEDSFKVDKLNTTKTTATDTEKSPISSSSEQGSSLEERKEKYSQKKPETFTQTSSSNEDESDHRILISTYVSEVYGYSDPRCAGYEEAHCTYKDWNSSTSDSSSHYSFCVGSSKVPHDTSTETETESQNIEKIGVDNSHENNFSPQKQLDEEIASKRATNVLEAYIRAQQIPAHSGNQQQTPPKDHKYKYSSVRSQKKFPSVQRARDNEQNLHQACPQPCSYLQQSCSFQPPCHPQKPSCCTYSSSNSQNQCHYFSSSSENCSYSSYSDVSDTSDRCGYYQCCTSDNCSSIELPPEFCNQPCKTDCVFVDECFHPTHSVKAATNLIRNNKVIPKSTRLETATEHVPFDGEAENNVTSHRSDHTASAPLSQQKNDQVNSHKKLEDLQASKATYANREEIVSIIREINDETKAYIYSQVKAMESQIKQLTSKKQKPKCLNRPRPNSVADRFQSHDSGVIIPKQKSINGRRFNYFQ